MPLTSFSDSHSMVMLRAFNKPSCWVIQTNFGIVPDAFWFQRKVVGSFSDHGLIPASSIPPVSMRQLVNIKQFIKFTCKFQYTCSERSQEALFSRDTEDNGNHYRRFHIR